MSMQDPVADMLTRVRNAQKMSIKNVSMPYSSFKFEILKVLKDEGFIEAVEMHADGNKKNLEVTLKYHQGQAVIESIKRISKPALRVYRPCKNLPIVRGGLGVAIISTARGVMTDKTARANNLGGEVVCTIE